MAFWASTAKLQTRTSIGENVAQHLFCLGGGASYTVKNTIAIIMAKPARSVGKNTVPNIRRW